MNENENFNNEIDTNKIEKGLNEIEQAGNEIDKEIAKSDGSEFFNHSKQNNNNISDSTSINQNKNNNVNDIQVNKPMNMNNNPVSDANNQAVQDSLNKNDKNNKNKSKLFSDNNEDKDKKDKDTKDKKDTEKKEKNLDTKDKKDKDTKDKKGGVKSSNTLKKAQSKASNAGNKGEDAHEKSEGEEAVDKIGRGAAALGDKLLTVAKEGIKKLWDALPIEWKLIVIGAVALIFIIFLIILMAVAGSDEDFATSGKTISVEQQTLIEEYIKGTLYNIYQKNEEYDDTNVIFAQSYSIYVRSLAYEYYSENRTFDENSIPFLEYNASYKALLGESDEELSDETDSSNNNINNEEIVVDDAETEKENSFNSDFNVDILSEVDNTSGEYFMEPLPINQLILDQINSLANEDKTLDEVIINLTENKENFQILEDYGDSYFYTPIGSGTYTIDYCGPINLNKKYPKARSKQCAAQAYQRSTTFLEKINSSEGLALFNKVSRGDSAAIYWINNYNLGKNGFKTGSEPAVGALAVFMSNYSIEFLDDCTNVDGSPMACGHIFFLESKNEDGTYNTFECSGGYWCEWKKYSAEEIPTKGKEFVGYIYLMEPGCGE